MQNIQNIINLYYNFHDKIIILFCEYKKLPMMNFILLFHKKSSISSVYFTFTDFGLFLLLFSSQLTYSVVLAWRVEPRDSFITCDTQCSSWKVPPFMPINHLTHPHCLLQQPSVCSPYSRVSYGFPPPLFLSYFSFPSPKSICCVSQIAHMSKIIWYLSSWLTYFT